MRVKTELIGEVRSLVYTYDIGPDMSFRFYTLDEVGEAWQSEAKKEAERTAEFWGLSIVHGVEIDRDPWIVDALVDMA